MEENKNPIPEKKELTDENVEQVAGGVKLPLNMGANGSGGDAASSAAVADSTAAQNSWVVPAGISSGAAILIGGQWVAIDHQQPVKTFDRHKPSPASTQEEAPRSR